ncbi:L-fucose:H+ symporter permease [Cyclobacterium roseum]|uniref:L-fucose:H+ symporter permease n=1 Tax=Cyclobacterium roseum TaxID=2666137 RepID=UPI00139076EF|nr:L-fucose:H+ symporter permease [Cyclobacterium roseum]
MSSQITSEKAGLISKKNFWPFLLLTTLFMLWGVAHNMTDTLLAAFKRIMSMTDFQTSWIQLAFYGSYFCLALPAAIFIRKYTYKSGILLGLGLFALGSLLFYPAGIMMSYGFFLVALYVLAGGLSILETAANPYILVIGPPETATQRLNLAQSFNPIGSVIGVYLSKVFILSQLNTAEAADRTTMDPETLKAMQAEELAGVVSTYVGVALFLVVVWFVIRAVRMPVASEIVEKDGIIAGFKRLSKNKNYMRGVMAQFFYVGAQIGVWSFTIRYVMGELEVLESGASNYYLVSLILFAGSRFLFTALMKYFKPSILLAISSFVAILLSLVVIYGSGMVAVISLVLISVCMSLMFPTIYGLSAEGLGNDTKLGGSGLIMAILGGALITAAQGQVSDISGNIQLSYYVPLICFGVVMYFGLSHYFHRPEPKAVKTV